MNTRSTRLQIMVAGLGIALTVAACGSSPVATGGGTATADGEADSALTAVYDEVDGLTGTERMDKLVELAQSAGGQVGWYYVGNMDPIIEAFQEKTGLTVSAYQGISEDLAERAGQESQTNRPGSDLLLGAAVDLRTMDSQGLLGELDSPVLDTVDEGYKGYNAISPYSNVMVLAYNDDLVPADQQASDYQDLFENPPSMGIETGDWQWYENMVRTYFMEGKGMSEQEAIDLITNGLRGAQQSEGHSLLVELLASGQYGATPHAFAHTVEPLVDAEAPVAYADSANDTPPFLLPNTMALTKGGANPAGGLALLEWLMSNEGQQMFADRNYGTTSSTFTGPTIIDDYPDAVVADLYLDDSPEDITYWQTKYNELLQAIGR